MCQILEQVVQRIGFAERRAVMTKNVAQNRNYGGNRSNEILSIGDHRFLWHRFGHVVAWHCSLISFSGAAYSVAFLECMTYVCGQLHSA